jgi:hypothetical protein
MDDADYTGLIGDLHQDREPPEWPMYSYSRPAYLFWNGFANALRERGLSDAQIRVELQSKGTRWLLDARSNHNRKGTGDRSQDGSILGPAPVPYLEDRAMLVYLVTVHSQHLGDCLQLVTIDRQKAEAEAARCFRTCGRVSVRLWDAEKGEQDRKYALDLEGR